MSFRVIYVHVHIAIPWIICNSGSLTKCPSVNKKTSSHKPNGGAVEDAIVYFILCYSNQICFNGTVFIILLANVNCMVPWSVNRCHCSRGDAGSVMQPIPRAHGSGVTSSHLHSGCLPGEGSVIITGHWGISHYHRTVTDQSVSQQFQWLPFASSNFTHLYINVIQCIQI